MQNLKTLLLFLIVSGGAAATFAAPVPNPVDPSCTTSNAEVPTPKTIQFLLQRNLDVFGENDPLRRRAMIDESYTEDCVFYEPGGGVYRGREAIDAIAGKIREKQRDFRYQLIAESDVTGNGGRIRWVEGRPGEVPAVAGTDVILVRDGRIAGIYLFFDKAP